MKSSMNHSILNKLLQMTFYQKNNKGASITMANSLVSIQIIPTLENSSESYAYVDAAIAVIEESGVKYQVNPLETTMEGELSELLDVVQAMNEKMVSMGAINVISQVKIVYQPDGITAETLTEKYR